MDNTDDLFCPPSTDQSGIQPVISPRVAGIRVVDQARHVDQLRNQHF
jgi:hypothetical protein